MPNSGTQEYGLDSACPRLNQLVPFRNHVRQTCLRACANRRVSYVSKSSKKAVQSLREMSCAKGCPPIGAASKSVTDYKEFPWRSHHSVIGGDGWEEIADYALEWAVENAKRPAA